MMALQKQYFGNFAEKKQYNVMDNIYVLVYADGCYYCRHSVNTECKTKMLGLAQQYNDVSTASVVAEVRKCTLRALVPVIIPETVFT